MAEKGQDSRNKSPRATGEAPDAGRSVPGSRETVRGGMPGDHKQNRGKTSSGQTGNAEKSKAGTTGDIEDSEPERNSGRTTRSGI